MDLQNKQDRVFQKVNEEYLDYISGLSLLDKQDIISESQRTTFYTDILLVLRDRTLSEKQLKYLDRENILPVLYECYLVNDYDYLDAMSRGDKVIYQFVKEQKSMEM